MDGSDKPTWYVGRVTGAIAAFPLCGEIAFGTYGFLVGLLLSILLVATVTPLRHMVRSSSTYQLLIGTLSAISIGFFLAILFDAAPAWLLRVIWALLALGIPFGFMVEMSRETGQDTTPWSR